MPTCLPVVEGSGKQLTTMKFTKKLLSVLASAVALGFLGAGCKEKTESEKAADAIRDAARKTEDAAKDAARKTEEALKDAAKKADDALKK